MNDADFVWIQEWYQTQCDGYWEHAHGIIIETVDNPGWYVTIDLTETYLEDANFDKIEEDKNDLDWFFCLKKDSKFEASCAPCKLNTVFKIFRKWAENCMEE